MQTAQIVEDRELGQLSHQIEITREQEEKMMRKFDMMDMVEIIQAERKSLEHRHQLRQNLVILTNTPDDVRLKLITCINAHSRYLHMHMQSEGSWFQDIDAKTTNHVISYDGFRLRYSRCGALLCFLDYNEEICSLVWTTGDEACDCDDCEMSQGESLLQL